MKNILFFLLLLLLPLAACAQFPNSPNKIRLGNQTTGLGLVHPSGGVPSWTPTTINNAWAAMDTTSGALYAYFAGQWNALSGSDGNGFFTVGNNNDTLRVEVAYIAPGAGFTIRDTSGLAQISLNENQAALVAGNSYVQAIKSLGYLLMQGDSLLFNTGGSFGTAGQVMTATGSGGAFWQDAQEIDSLTTSNDTLFLYTSAGTFFVVLPPGSTEVADSLTILGDGTGGDPFRVDTTLLATLSVLQDTASAIRGDYPASIYTDSGTVAPINDMLVRLRPDTTFSIAHTNKAGFENMWDDYDAGATFRGFYSSPGYFGQTGITDMEIYNGGKIAYGDISIRARDSSAIFELIASATRGLQNAITITGTSGAGTGPVGSSRLSIIGVDQGDTYSYDLPTKYPLLTTSDTVIMAWHGNGVNTSLSLLGFVPIPSGSSSQTLSLAGDTLSISGGNSVVLPGGTDGNGIFDAANDGDTVRVEHAFIDRTQHFILGIESGGTVTKGIEYQPGGSIFVRNFKSSNPTNISEMEVDDDEQARFRVNNGTVFSTVGATGSQAYINTSNSSTGKNASIQTNLSGQIIANATDSVIFNTPVFNLYPRDTAATLLRFYETASTMSSDSNYVALRAGTVSQSYTLTLPGSPPADGDVLGHASGGILNWVAPGSGSTFANNGNIMSGDTVQWGGALIKDTEVNTAGRVLWLRDNADFPYIYMNNSFSVIASDINTFLDIGSTAGQAQLIAANKAYIASAGDVEIQVAGELRFDADSIVIEAILPTGTASDSVLVRDATTNRLKLVAQGGGSTIDSLTYANDTLSLYTSDGTFTAEIAAGGGASIYTDSGTVAPIADMLVRLRPDTTFSIAETNMAGFEDYWENKGEGDYFYGYFNSMNYFSSIGVGVFEGISDLYSALEIGRQSSAFSCSDTTAYSGVSLYNGDPANNGLAGLVSIGGKKPSQDSYFYTLPGTSGTEGQVLTKLAADSTGWRDPAGAGTWLKPELEADSVVINSAGNTLAFNITNSADPAITPAIRIQMPGNDDDETATGIEMRDTVNHRYMRDVYNGSFVREANTSLTFRTTDTLAAVRLQSGSGYSQQIGGVDGGLRVVNGYGKGAKLRLTDYTNGGGYVQVASPDTTDAAWTLTLPKNPGTSGQVLQTNGAGVTTWTTPSSGGVTGSGTTGTIPVWSGSTALGDSPLTVASGNVTATGTGSFRLPNGTDAQRPGTPSAGETRYNTTNGNLEFYGAAAWEPALKSGTANGLGTAGRVFYADANGRAAANDDLYWNATSNYLGVGVTPTTFLHVNGTVAPTGSTNTGGIVQITGSGSVGGIVTGLRATLLAGYTGPSSNFGLYAQNQSAGSSTDEFGNAQAANYGEYIATTAGTIIGQAGYAAGGNRSYGGLFRAIVNKNSATNIGVAGYAINGGTSPVQIGGIFALRNALPTMQSAALIADNGTQTDPIFLARDNNTVVMGIYDGGNVGIGNTSPQATLHVTGSFSRGAPVTKTGNFTVAATENWLIVNNASASTTVTLPTASTNTGRELMLKNLSGTYTVISNASNVVPLAGGAAGTAILPATAGAWATLVSDGTNWIIMQSN